MNAHMKRVLTIGVTSGFLSALLIGTIEGLLGQGRGLLSAAAFGALLLLPLGIGMGFALSLMPFLLPLGRRPSDWLRALLSSEHPKAAAAVLVYGAFSLAFTGILFHLIYFFFSEFHHMGLASLCLTVLLPTLFAATFALCAVAADALSTGLAKQRFSLAKRPLVSLCLVLTLWGVAVIPPFLKGPEASGMFGFVGLLAKDGLKAGPLVSLMLIAVFTTALGAILSKRQAFSSRTLQRSIGVGAGAAFIASLLLAHLLAASTPAAVDRIDSAEGAAGLVAKVIRKFGDRDGDGHSRWMGGKDCDDTNPRIYPRARDIPDNGIDEDCSGADLNLTELLAKAATAEPPANTGVALVAPDLPEDVSLFLISIDTLRWNAPGFMGYERDITPNLDKLVENGTIYDRAYGLGSYTGQAVPPMMTGKYASELHRNDKHETRIGADETFAAELICGEKVQCAAYLPHFLFKPRSGWNAGFQEWTVVDASPPGPGHIDTKYNSDRIAKSAMEWLDNPENTKGRFFLWTHFLDPHKEYIEHPGFQKFGSDRRAKYDHEVLFTDFHIGKMVDKFLSMSVSRRTVIIITADHGEAFNEHGRWCHGKELWEEIIRVPLAIVGPGIPKKRIARPTSQIDLFPTLLDIFGVEIPKGIHGRSLLPDWVAGQQVAERPIIADQPRNTLFEPRRIFIKDGWKLHDLPDNNSYRLYHLTGDLEEGDSLVDTEPEAFERIKAAYDLFVATELKEIPAVSYDMGPLDRMPMPDK